MWILEPQRVLCAALLIISALSFSAFAQSDSGSLKFQGLTPAETGINWSHFAAKSPNKFLPESSAPGCAVIDYNNDGWPDLYFVNSGPSEFFVPKNPLKNALYRNNHDGTFTDVTDSAAVPGNAFGMGAAVGDYDNDGLPDLLVTEYGRSVLYHNNGKGTFTDVTAKAHIETPGWASSAVWFDYDNDGKLDLFVGQFAHLDLETGCGPVSSRRYCIPKLFESRPSWLFHNNGNGNGNGTFTEVGKEAGIAVPGKAWGAVATDIDNDGLLDLWVVNDTDPNRLFHNLGNGHFEEIGFRADLAFSIDGKTRSGMGVDSADFDDDGWMDLFVSNIDQEIFSLYRNRHDRSFADQAMDSGIGIHTRWLSGWGSKFFDVDNDGRLDLFVVNGHPDDMADEAGTEVTFQEPLKLFHRSSTAFKDVSESAGPAFARKYSARGLVTVDFDNDGRVDAVVCMNDGPPLVLHNESDKTAHWLGIKLVGKNANRDAVGARVRYQVNGEVHHRMVVGGGSFMSYSDARVMLGAGASKKIDWVEVQWPGSPGKIERIINVPIDRYVTLTEGEKAFH